MNRSSVRFRQAAPRERISEARRRPSHLPPPDPEVRLRDGRSKYVMNDSGMYDDDSSRMDVLELLVSEAMGDEGAVTEVIRPSAVIPEEAARTVLMELAL